MASAPENLDRAPEEPPGDKEGKKEKKERSGPLYAQTWRPEHVRKTRNPKVVQAGLEAAFRKRQNIALKKDKAEVVSLLNRVLSERCDDEASLRELFRETSERLCNWGIALGGSEDWADRLYIEVDKKGGLLFSEEELDVAEEAQKRMELMYNVDAWSTQLVVKVGAGKLLLTSGIEGTKDECLTRIIKRIEEDVKYYSELFDEPTSQLIPD